MAAITELDFSNGNNDSSDVTDTDVSAGGNFGDFIEVTLAASETPNDYVVVLFQDNGEVAAIIRFDAIATLNSYPGPNGQEIYVFGSSVVPNIQSGGFYNGQSTANWNKIDLSLFSQSSAYAAGNSYGAGTYSSDNPAAGLGNQGSGLRHFLNGSINATNNASEPRHIMLLNDSTGQVEDFYSLGNTPGTSAIVGAPGGGAISTVVPNTGSNSANFAHYANGGGTGSSPLQALVQNPGEIVCFANGTRILTSKGYKRVETLRVGEQLETLDAGPMELRWLGACRVEAQGRFAPIHIPAGVIDNNRPLLVSPLHRFLVTDPWVELATGVSECLIAAKHMVGYHGVRRMPLKDVTYWHVLMDRHHLVWADGALAESFFLGPHTFSSIEAEVQSEILALFPELAFDLDTGYGDLVRASASRGECMMIMENLIPSGQRNNTHANASV